MASKVRTGLVMGAVVAALVTGGVTVASASSPDGGQPSAKPEGCSTNYYVVTRDGARIFYYRVGDAAIVPEGYRKGLGASVTGMNGGRNKYWTHVHTGHGDNRGHYMVSSSLKYVGCR